MKKQTGFTLIEILIVLAVSIIVAAGGKVIREQKVKPIPTPTSYPTLSPIPTPILTPQPTEQPKTISCQTDSDCPQSNVLIPKCLGNRCVYVKDTRSLQSCLKEANQARKRVCEEMNIPLDEYGNCVGVDFVKDPYQECYDKYGQK